MPDGAYDFCNPNGEPLDFVAVTGAAGSGKTRLLEAIVLAKEAVASSGAQTDPRSFIRDDALPAKVVLWWSFDEEERMYGGLEAGAVVTEAVFSERRPISTFEEDAASIVLARYAQQYGPRSMFGVSGKVEYFPARRHAMGWAGTDLDESQQRSLCGSGDPSKFAFVPRMLRAIATSDWLGTFAGHVDRFASGLRFDANAASRGEPCFLNGKPTACRFTELASYQSDAVLIAATATLIGLDRSTVLVDRPEQYANSGTARAIVDAWRRIGHGAQVIAATSWSELVSLLPSECVVRL